MTTRHTGRTLLLALERERRRELLSARADSFRTGYSSHAQQRGSVLVLTLWLAAGLAVSALLAGHVALLRYRRGANQIAAMGAEHAIDAGRCYVAQWLTSLGKPGTLPSPDAATTADIAVGDCRLWLLGRSAESTAEEPVFALQDEGGRLNLNTATIDMLSALPGMTPELAAAIVDWRDSDDELTSSGAESETYLARTPPYTAKNGPFDTVDELRLLNGAAAYLLDGVDRNRNTLLETWEKDLARQNRERLRDAPDYGLLDLVTVSSREPDTTATGQRRTDLNGDARTVRQALQEVFGNRGADLAAAGGVGTTRFASVLQFCLAAGLTDSEAESAFDRFTVNRQGSVINGRVNLNTAPAAVLACLPGIGVDNAERLVAYREQNPDGLTTPLWLARALGDDLAKTVAAAGDCITTQCYQVSADIVAVGPAGRAFRRTRFVFDLTTGSPLVVSRRDLTHLGWPLGPALHQTLIVASGGTPR